MSAMYRKLLFIRIPPCFLFIAYSIKDITEFDKKKIKEIRCQGSGINIPRRRARISDSAGYETLAMNQGARGWNRALDDSHKGTLIKTIIQVGLFDSL